MAYIPKTKYIKKETSGLDYQDPETGKPYSGPMILTSNGAFMGESIHTIKGPLQPIKIPSNISKPKLAQTSIINEYHKLKQSLSSKISKTLDPLSTKPIPEKKHYKKGYIIRYFVKRINSNSYFEVNKKVFESLDRQDMLYDYNLYNHYNIRWALGNDAKNINQKKET